VRITDSLLRHIEDILTGSLAQSGQFSLNQRIRGGDINHCFKSHFGDRELFLKINSASRASLLLTEFNSLKLLAAEECIRTPKPIVAGDFEDYSYLIMEFLPVSAQGNEFSLGQALAKLHRPRPQECFGWIENNYIGTNKQSNIHHKCWNDFWLKERMQIQWFLALEKGFTKGLEPLQARLFSTSAELLSDHQPTPALLHGDLWSGNKGFTAGEPLIFDPASYYGDRETDLAFSELFGGFGQDFYAGYNSTFPLPESYQQRKHLYNLYHMLNHLNLFGQTYLAPCISLSEKVISLGEH